MKNVLIIGINNTNPNYKKIYGFINSFKKKYNVFHISDDSTDTINRCISENHIDTIFCETANFMNINFKNIKNCILWSNYDIIKIMTIAESNLNTKFIFCCKSPIHDEEIVKKYITNHGKNYSVHEQEGQDLQNFINIFNKSKKINKDTAVITNNLCYTYLPCSLSELGTIRDIEYDLCYFGTIHNRPLVNQTLIEFGKKGYRVISTLFSGNIKPEKCIEIYSKTICTISEQVHPVGLEYPVRLGESTANGCRFFLYDTFGLSPSISEKIPDYTTIKNSNEIVTYIDKIRNDDSERKKLYNNFHSTYDNSVNELVKLLELQWISL